MQELALVASVQHAPTRRKARPVLAPAAALYRPVRRVLEPLLPTALAVAWRGAHPPPPRALGIPSQHPPATWPNHYQSTLHKYRSAAVTSPLLLPARQRPTIHVPAVDSSRRHYLSILRRDRTTAVTSRVSVTARRPRFSATESINSVNRFTPAVLSIVVTSSDCWLDTKPTGQIAS